MRYAIASWDFPQDDVPLARQVEWFADHGFDAVSFDPPKQPSLLDRAQLQDVATVVRRRNLAVTLHGSSPIDPATVGLLAERFGPRLLNVTMNPIMRPDSRGNLVDARRIAAHLSEIERITRGTDVCFGVEDIPRDSLALEFYREAFEQLLGCPRFGTLIDLGHMNMWLQTQEYYRGISPSQYLANVPVPIVEVHVHDNDGRRDSHQPLRAGNLAVGEAAAALRGRGFDRVSTIEISPAAHGATVSQCRPAAVESLHIWRSVCQGSAQ